MIKFHATKHLLPNLLPNLLTPIFSGFLGCFLLLNSCSSSNPNQTQGYIEGDLTYIASSQPGRLSYLAVSRGQEVKKDQVLFTIEPEPRSFSLKNAQASLEQAKDNLLDLLDPIKRPTEQASILAQIKSAEAELLYSNLQLERNKYLIKTEAVQQQAVDQAVDQATQALENVKDLESQLATAQLPARTNQIKAAAAEVDVAQSFLEQAAWDLDQTIVRAPEDSFVFDNLYWPGEEVPANTPVLTLLSPDHIKVLFYVPAFLVVKIKLGELISFQDNLNNSNNLHTGSATITYISPTAEYTPPVIYSRDREEDLVFRIEASFSNPQDALLWHPGEPVTVTMLPKNQDPKNNG